MVSAAATVAPGKLPKIATSEPGATAVPCPCESLVKLPAFNTPPEAMEGCASSAVPMQAPIIKIMPVFICPQNTENAPAMNRAGDTANSIRLTRRQTVARSGHFGIFSTVAIECGLRFGRGLRNPSFFFEHLGEKPVRFIPVGCVGDGIAK